MYEIAWHIEEPAQF